MNIRKTGPILLLGIFAASVFSGCGKTISETGNTIVASETSAEITLPSETLAQDPVTSVEPKTFEEVYGNQLMGYLNHQYYFDGEPVSLQESNFYFINAFLELSSDANMGYYPVTPSGGIDLAAELEVEIDDYGTYGDYFVKYAENALEMSLTLCSYARANDIPLSEDTKLAIDNMLDNIRYGSAANAGMSLDDYLQLYYGPGTDEATFRKILERYYLADAYSDKYCKEYPFSDDQIRTPYIRYALFYAPVSADQDTKDQAYQSAMDMKDSCNNLSELKSLAQSAYENGIVREQGDSAAFASELGEYPGLWDWTFEEERKEGDIEVIYEPSVGYYVIGYLGIKDQITYVPYVRYALFQPKDTDQVSLTDAYTAAKAMKDACGSISDLTGLAETAYKNGEVLDYGDILVTKGQLDKNFEDWAYDENRTDGELDIIYSPDFGYFVIGYIRTEKQISGLLTDIAMKDLTNIALEESNSGVHDFHTDDEYLPAPAAPTATPVPDIELTDDGTEETVMNTEATEASAPVAQPQQNGSTKTADVLVVVFFTLAGVAIAAIIAVLIYSAVNNRIRSSGVSREDPDDDPDDNADETEKDSGEDREDGSAEDDESEEDGDEDDEDNED
ncbi:MAG: hypothetical protein IKE09_10985 [Clostridiales bacterium]|nr:hypothetical protein [Clostridiales bacterium]